MSCRKFLISGELWVKNYYTLDGIASKSTSNLECLRGTLKHWLQHDPRASWRRLIWKLDSSQDADLHRLTRQICRKGVRSVLQLHRHPFGSKLLCRIQFKPFQKRCFLSFFFFFFWQSLLPLKLYLARL